MTKKALIDTNTSISHTVSWVRDSKGAYVAIEETYPNSCRVCEVTDSPFDVASPLTWVDCSDEVRADEFWFDSSTQTIKPIENAPIPLVNEIPVTEL